MFLKITKFIQKLCQKTLLIIDFLVCEIGIASFFQPKWTSFSCAVLSIFSKVRFQKFYSKNYSLKKHFVNYL